LHQQQKTRRQVPTAKNRRIVMRPAVMSTILLLLTLSAGGCEANKPITMKILPSAEIGPEATAVKSPAGGPAIEVVDGAEGGTFTLATCDHPELSEHDHMVHGQLIEYVVRGRVKYVGVEGDGYLELLSEFAGGNCYRDHLKLGGTAEWESFQIGPPTQSGQLLRRLTLNVVLPAGGALTVAEPLVVTPRNVDSAWCTPAHAVWIGLGLCAVIAIMGGSAFLLAAWGKSRRLAMRLLVIGLAISGVSLIAGLAALCAGQPWPIYFQLLLQGGIGLVVWGANVPNILRYFHAAEMRRMSAADVV
jgi:hypothetical protein